jgi:S1-C subfamily serine protease
VNAADSLIFQTEKQLKEYGDKIPEEKKKEIDEALTELKTAHAAKDLAVIDSAMEKLNTAFQAASQDMYQATNENSGSADQGSNKEGNKGKYKYQLQKKQAEAKKKQQEEENQKKEANAKLYIIGSGTGFFVSAEGHIVSNDHVVGICRNYMTLCTQTQRDLYQNQLYKVWH